MRTVYNETINREIKIKPISEFRCDERLKTLFVVNRENER
jgi:hypothetical protein